MNFQAFHDAVTKNGGNCMVLTKGRKEDGGNLCDGWCDSPAVVGKGIPYCVEVRNGLVVFDIDHEKGVTEALQAVQILASINMKAALWESSDGSGKAHLWVPYDSESEYLTICGIVDKMIVCTKPDNRRDNSRIRPPFSPHTTGVNMNLIHPPTEAEALQILQLGTGRPPQRAATVEPQRKPKPKDYKRPSVTPSLERTFTESVPKGQRSQRVFANACRSKGVGMTADQWCAKVLEHPNGIGEKAYEKSNPSRWLITQVWDKAKPSNGGLRDPEAIRQIEAIEIAARSWEPPKRQTGATALLCRIIELAISTGKIELAISLAQAGAWTASNKNTGRNRLKWLEDAGWLVKIRNHSEVEAAVYRLQIPAELKGYTPPYTPADPEGVYEGIRLIQSHPDAFIGRSLGLTILRKLVTMEAATSKEIAEILERKHSSIKKNLQFLHSIGLVSLEAGVYRPTVTEGRLLEAARLREEQTGCRPGRYVGRVEAEIERVARNAEGRREHLARYSILNHRILNKIRKIEDRRYEEPPTPQQADSYATMM
jgi:predicted ArsR family transcriptional regulator